MAAYGEEKFLTFLFSPNGRTCRREYWLRYMLPYIGVSIVASFLDLAVFGLGGAQMRGAGPFGAIVGLFYFWPSIAVTVKRLHDRGFSGWWILGQIVPLMVAAIVYISQTRAGDSAGGSSALSAIVLVIAILFWLYFVVQVLFLRGQPHDNKYGPDPLYYSADVFK